MKRQKFDTELICYSVSDYVKLKNERLNTPVKLSNGNYTYLVDGNWINQEAFNKLRPMPTYRKFNEKGMTIGSLLKD